MSGALMANHCGTYRGTKRKTNDYRHLLRQAKMDGKGAFAPPPFVPSFLPPSFLPPSFLPAKSLMPPLSTPALSVAMSGLSLVMPQEKSMHSCLSCTSCKRDLTMTRDKRIWKKAATTGPKRFRTAAQAMEHDEGEKCLQCEQYEI